MGNYSYYWINLNKLYPIKLYIHIIYIMQKRWWNKLRYYLNTLDKIRVYKGTRSLKSFFNNLVEYNIDEAIQTLNDSNLHFSSLFLLKPQIYSLKIFNKLSNKNRLSLLISDEILSGKRKLLTTNNLIVGNNNYIIPTLKWMFITGFKDDGLNSEFDKVLDIISVILSKECKERSILPIVVNITFSRYKNDSYFYDLIWGFFQSKNPQSLVLIAPYFLSENPKDVKLATRLLNFLPDIDLNSVKSNREKYLIFINWIKENHRFLCFTGESFQRRYDPKPYRLILEGKYLCKSVSVDTGRIADPLTDIELSLIREFKKESKENKKILCEFSYKLNQSNKNLWNKWINTPFKKQLDIAKKGRCDLL